MTNKQITTMYLEEILKLFKSQRNVLKSKKKN